MHFSVPFNEYHFNNKEHLQRIIRDESFIAHSIGASFPSPPRASQSGKLYNAKNCDAN